VPVEAVIREGDGATVWVQSSQQTFERRNVTLGLEQDGRVQIRKRVEGPVKSSSGAARSSSTTSGSNEGGQTTGPDRGPMIRAVIAFCLARRPLVLVVLARFSR